MIYPHVDSAAFRYSPSYQNSRQDNTGMNHNRSVVGISLISDFKHLS